MKLLRASCPCGFNTRKVRSGYHHDKWWFPLFSKDTGTLGDIELVLPVAERKWIDQQQIDLYHKTPRDDKPAWREASATMQAFGKEVRGEFIKHQTRKLRSQYGLAHGSVFDPPMQSTFRCPGCDNETLFLDHVYVQAICKQDCGYQYSWPDSEERGCPQCGYRSYARR